MPRIERVVVGGYIYHVINRANVRIQIFDTEDDYRLFESILEEGKERTVGFGVSHHSFSVFPQDLGSASRVNGG